MVTMNHAARQMMKAADANKALATREEAPAEAGEAVARIEKYLSERAKSRQLDQNEIHGMHIGDVREAVLTAEDLRALISALRTQPQAREEAQPVPFMFAYEDVDKPGEWRAFRHQIKRADGSICPGRALFTSPPAPEAEKLRERLEAAFTGMRTYSGVTIKRIDVQELVGRALAALQQDDLSAAPGEAGV